jgi:hypothetical protein
MADTEVLIPLAEIAGVFVGFGALIAVRGSGPTEPLVIAPMRGVVSMGMLAVTAALIPVTAGHFELTEHEVWALSSVLTLVGWLVLIGSMAGTSEWRAGWAAEIEATRVVSRRLRWWRLVQGAFYVLYLIVVCVTPIVILLGVLPDLDAALYYALVVLILLGAGWTLLELVFAQRLPASA